MGSEVIPAVDDVSFDIYKGEFCCLLGTSGSGKSTFVNMLNRLIDPTNGQILLDGIDITQIDKSQPVLVKKRIFF